MWTLGSNAYTAMAKAADQSSSHSVSITDVLNKSNSVMDPVSFQEILSRGLPATCAKDMQDDEITNMLLDMVEDECRQKEAEYKRKKEIMFGLPENPASYTSSHTKVWINQALIDIDVPEDHAAEIVSKLDHPNIPNITGASVSRWSREQWQEAVGTNGDVLYRKFNFWTDDFKKNNPNDHKPPQDAVLPILPLTCTEQEKLLERGMDKNKLQELFTCPDELKHKYPLSKHEHIDQIVPSPTHQPVSFNFYLPYHSYPSPPLYDPNMYGNPLPPYPSMGKVKFDPVDTWIPCPGSPDSLGSTGAYSDESGSVIGAKLQPPLYQPHYLQNGPLPGFSIFQQRTALQSDSCIEESMSMPVNMTKRKRGRPRKMKPPKQKNKQPILYKFILEHLEDPKGRQYVEWVHKSDGVFKFHSAQKEAFAKKWGECKAKGGSREPMTYSNMARALRNYTIGKNGKRNIMERVKKKLHYKFVAGVQPTSNVM